ncbi:MAG: AMP-binding protein, partial [Ruminococcus sp.]|nr:AMP-binding protein [Ruminococcus sp.]
MYNILEYIEHSAKCFEEKTAVVDEISSISYKQLLEKSRRIGSALAGKIRQGEPIAVYMEKGVDALCAFFGIVAAGGCYCMVNTELPGHRVEQICSVLNAEKIITSRALLELAGKQFANAEIFAIENLAEHEINFDALETIRSKMIDTDPLYINFTSGSTGVPKGIVVCHRSVIDFIGQFTETFGISSADVIANQAPFDFDVSVKDIYSAIKTGATLLIVPRRLFSAPTALIDFLCNNRATVMIWAVSALCLISTFHGLDYRVPKTVRMVLFSGEVMPFKHLCTWQAHLPNTMFVNLYGPTEITCNCTFHILEQGRDYSQGIPIGKAFANEDVFLLNGDDKRITEPDMVGEICVRGTTLALGYYRAPEQTA